MPKYKVYVTHTINYEFEVTPDPDTDGNTKHVDPVDSINIDDFEEPLSEAPLTTDDLHAFYKNKLDDISNMQEYLQSEGGTTELLTISIQPLKS